MKTSGKVNIPVAGGLDGKGGQLMKALLWGGKSRGAKYAGNRPQYRHSWRWIAIAIEPWFWPMA